MTAERIEPIVIGACRECGVGFTLGALSVAGTTWADCARVVGSGFPRLGLL